MQGSDLRQIMTSAGLSSEQLADRLGVSVATIKFYLKPSVTVSAKIAEKAKSLDTQDLAGQLKDARQCLQKLHKGFFENSGTNVYGYQIPNFKVSEFDGTPTIHGGHEDIDVVANFEDLLGTKREAPITWNKWKTGFLARCQRHKDNEPVEKKTLLLGRPGTGKTTIIKLLLLNQLEEFTIICLPLSIYNEKSPRSILDAACRHYVEYMEYNSPLPFKKFLEYEVNERRLIVLLDGFDEADEEARESIFKQISRAPFPTLVTSRFVSPHLLTQAFTSERYYMGCLKAEDIRRYIAMVRTGLHKAGNNTGEALLINLEKVLNDHLRVPLLHETPNAETFGETLLKEAFEMGDFGKEANPWPYQRSPLEDKQTHLASSDRERSTWMMRHLEAIQLMRTPILLNLYLATCIRDNNIHSSLTDILASYAKFLFGNWNTSRVLTPSAPKTMSVSEVEVNQALGVIAVVSLLTDYANGSALTVKNAMEFLTQFFGSYTDWEEKELNDFVKSWLTAAENANILTVDSQTNVLRFTAPHELLASYYASVYLSIVQSYNFTQLQTFRVPAVVKKIKSVPPELMIGYQEVASNPNLRCLQDAVVFLIQRMTTDSQSAVPTNEAVLFDLLHTLPVSPDESGCSEEDMRQILPTGLIMAARAIRPIVKSRHEVYYRTIIETIRDEVSELFETTNIEYVYQALLPLYRALNINYAGREQRASTAQRANADPERSRAGRLDLVWRSAETCEELISYVDNVKLLTNKMDRQKLLRRFVYRMRYLASSFDDEAFHWVKSVLRTGQKVDNNTSSEDMLTFATLRMIRDNLRGQGVPKVSPSVLKEISNFVDATEAMLHGKMLSYKKELIRFRGNDEEAWEGLIQSDNFDFSVLKWYPSVYESVIPRGVEEDKCARLIGKIADHLEEEQAKKTPTEQSKAIQAKALFLLRTTARGFRGQQFVLPSRCSLAKFNMYYPQAAASTQTQRIVKLLFNGATKSFAKGAQSSKWAIAGWQLYDFYAQLLWLTLSGLPSAAKYDLLD